MSIAPPAAPATAGDARSTKTAIRTAVAPATEPVRARAPPPHLRSPHHIGIASPRSHTAQALHPARQRILKIQDLALPRADPRLAPILARRRRSARLPTLAGVAVPRPPAPGEQPAECDSNPSV